MSAFIDALVKELAEDPEARARLREALATQPAARMLQTREAAARLGVHPNTLARAAREGRVPGARKAGPKLWVFDESELQMLPPIDEPIAPAGPGRPRRPLVPSLTTRAIAEAATRKAA